MRLATSPGNRRAGSWALPVWQALGLLVLPPLVAAAVMGGTLVISAQRAAEQALRAQKLVAAVQRLDAVRRSTVAEVLPTMLLVVLRDERHAAEAGFTAERRAILGATEPAYLAQARAATDRTLEAAERDPGTPELAKVLTRTLASLHSLRAAADRGLRPLETITDEYTEITSTLAAAQRTVNAQAISAGLSARTVAALQDLDQVLQLGETASSQLGELFASRVLPEPAASDFRRRWVAAWGTYRQIGSRADRLGTPSTRSAWGVFQSSGEVISFSDLLDRQAMDPKEEVLKTAALPGLEERSFRRNEALAVVLDDVVSAVGRSSRADRVAAEARARLMIEICLALLALSLLDVGLVARWLTRSMRYLAASARQISLGHLVDVDPRGPLELHTAARALSSAVAGLRRVQEQARAVVAGDIDEALRQQPLPGPLGAVVHASVEQIVDAFRAREALQEELAYQANHDALTGLPNRAQTLRHLATVLDRNRNARHRTGLLFIDLDGFKAVNDTHGHAAGDELLQEVSRRLLETIRPGDAVGRLGGDEFVVTVDEVTDAADLVQLGRRLIAEIRRPVSVVAATGVKQVGVGASVGVSVSNDGCTADALLAEADLAAYRAKRHGRGRVEFFDDDLRAELAERVGLEVALRQALNAGELRLHYQPVVNLASGELVGYEALARWSRAGVGPVPPDVFIAAAEASELVCDLGRWALAEAASQLTHWRATGLAGCVPGRVEPTVAVNISGRHLADPRVLTDVHDALSASGLPAELLVLEITETVLMDDPRCRQHLQELRALGVRVAIDDFGTGYTSINALSTTPADILKIDRSFVASDDPGRHQLATLITRAARTFSLCVVVEGVETSAQRERALADGCEYGQGYLFSRPLPAPELEQQARSGFVHATDAVPVPAAPTSTKPGTAQPPTPAPTRPTDQRRPQFDWSSP